MKGKKRWGKTALLKKIEQNYKNAIYIDFKGIEDVYSMDAVSAVVKSIEEDEDVLYLLEPSLLDMIIMFECSFQPLKNIFYHTTA